MSADLFAPIKPPDPVDELRYEQGDDEMETMILRADHTFVKWPYTITDCFVVRNIKRSIFGGPPRSVRVLDSGKLELKRREMFHFAYEELVRHVPVNQGGDRMATWSDL